MEQAINKDAKEWTDTFAYIWQTVLDIWQSLPVEMKAFVFMMFTISMIMQWYKKSFLTHCTKKQRVQHLWAIGMPLGIGLAILGWYLSNGKIATGYWVMMGLTVSTVAMGVHRVSVDYIWPAIKGLKNIRIGIRNAD